jgi:hypothetical protein
MARDHQDTIRIERRELVAEIREDYDLSSGTPMVVAAFKAAGEYLNDRAGSGNDLDEVEFEYLGVRFIAGYSRQ